MSIKTYFNFISAGLLIVSGSVFAGEMASSPASTEMSSHHYVYVDAQLGYAQSNWTDAASNGFMGNPNADNYSVLFSPTENGDGGFSAGGDIGYTITRSIGVEAGWMYLPQVNGLATPTAQQANPVPIAAGTVGSVNSWLSYAAARFMLPVYSQFDLFGKVGVGYRALTYTAPATFVNSVSGALGNGHYFAPVFAVGAEYNYQNWLFGGQYLYLPGNDAVNNGATTGPLAGLGAPNAAPEVNLYTGFIGYQFNV